MISDAIRIFLLGAILGAPIGISGKIESFDQHMLTWRCNQTGFCSGFDEAMKP